uniref:Uncharacterized protein n=1 Tax=Kuenenia stuttgartiensis TaxID=174633 RepID=Q1Q6X1_KUEST|nr:unknown protein [Candidatus Kuenenia stuttgartiensis]
MFSQRSNNTSDVHILDKQIPGANEFQKAFFRNPLVFYIVSENQKKLISLYRFPMANFPLSFMCKLFLYKV